MQLWSVTRTSRRRNLTLTFGVLQFRIMGDPPPEAWKRVQRYASWMHRVHVDDRSALGEDTFRKLRLNSPVGGWFPALQDLSWIITDSNLPHADLFFSPHLKKVTISVSWSWGESDISHDTLANTTSTIHALPAAALQILVIGLPPRGVPWAEFKEPLSSLVLRCGQSLTELTSPAPLSDAATTHLIQLPHLHTWFTAGSPPNFPSLSSPLVFPPLVQLTLWDSAACGWLCLFEQLEHVIPTARGLGPLSRMKESLRILNIKRLYDFTIDVSFTSPIHLFRNLISLNVGARCRDEDGNDRCVFKLNDNSATKLAMALPQMESLFLGHPCSKNTCVTTVACLLQISTHCIKLRNLVIHFNTTNIVNDLKSISLDPQFQLLRSLPRCTLSRLGVYLTPLTLDEPGLETVAHGMIDIFPSLGYCEGLADTWDDISERISKLQGL